MTPLQLGTQEDVNTQKNLLAIVASQPFYKTLVNNNLEGGELNLKRSCHRQ